MLRRSPRLYVPSDQNARAKRPWWGWWVVGGGNVKGIVCLRLQAVPFRQRTHRAVEMRFPSPSPSPSPSPVPVTRHHHPALFFSPRRPRRVCTRGTARPNQTAGQTDRVARFCGCSAAIRLTQLGARGRSPKLRSRVEMFSRSLALGALRRCRLICSHRSTNRRASSFDQPSLSSNSGFSLANWSRRCSRANSLCRRAYSNSPDRRNSNRLRRRRASASRGLPPTVGLPSRSRWAARKFPCRRAAVGRVLLRRAAIGGVVFGRRLLTLALSIRFFLAAASAIAIGGFAGATIGSGFLLSAIAACGSVHLLLDGAAGRLLRCRLVAGPAANLALALLVGLRAAFIGGRVLTGAAGARFVCLLTAALFTVPGAIAGRFALLIGLLLAYAGRLGLVALPLTRCFACLARLLWTRQIVGLRRRASCAIIGLLAGA